jgi:hypothetical protein
VWVEGPITPTSASIATSHVSAESASKTFSRPNGESAWAEWVRGRLCDDGVKSVGFCPIGLLRLVGLPACFSVWVVYVFLKANEEGSSVGLSGWRPTRLAGLWGESWLVAVEQVAASAAGTRKGIRWC